MFAATQPTDADVEDFERRQLEIHGRRPDLASPQDRKPVNDQAAVLEAERAVAEAYDFVPQLEIGGRIVVIYPPTWGQLRDTALGRLAEAISHFRDRMSYAEIASMLLPAVPDIEKAIIEAMEFEGTPPSDRHAWVSKLDALDTAVLAAALKPYCDIATIWKQAKDIAGKARRVPRRRRYQPTGS